MCSRSPVIPTICTARKVSSTRATTVQSLGDVHQLRSISNYSDHRTANETVMMLLRSIWSGDSVEKSTKTLEDVVEAEMSTSSLPVDVIFTSSLMGAQMTAVMAMSWHASKKTPNPGGRSTYSTNCSFGTYRFKLQFWRESGFAYLESWKSGHVVDLRILTGNP